MPPKKWLIVGLGNPGSQYENTRHNAGFSVVQAFAERLGIRGRSDARANAIVGTGQYHKPGHEAVPVVLCQPTTFMNASGSAVSSLLQYYRLSGTDDLIVIYDDTALPLGKIRIRPSGSAGGHNGIKSIIQSLGGGSTFARIRVGIGAPLSQQSLHHHVLARFTAPEAVLFKQVCEQSMDAMDTMLTEGLDAAMTRFNGQQLAPE